MKLSQVVFAWILLLASVVLGAAQAANESIYTETDSKYCKSLEFNEEGAYSRQQCPGIAGYKLQVIEGDLRQTIDVITPAGKKFALDFQGNVSGGFSSLGPKAEWRVQRSGKKITPKALIVRFNVSEDPEDSSKITSYLVVTKITPRQICVTDVVSPAPDANKQAQKLADEAATKSCKAQATALTDAPQTSFTQQVKFMRDAAEKSDIRKIDFANFTFRIVKEEVKIKDGLQEGSCQENADGIAEGSLWNVAAETIAYGDLDGDGAEEAIIPMVANVCGGNMITDDAVLVYTLKNDKLTQMPIFDYYDEGCKVDEAGCNFSRTLGVGVRYDAKQAALVVMTSFATEDDAICCPSLEREISYKWDGASFVAAQKGKIIKREEGK